LPRDFDHLAGHGLYSGVEGEDVLDTENSTMGQLTNSLNETVTMADIAELTGRDAGTLTGWSRRDDDFFPKAIPGTAKVSPAGHVMQQRWRLDDIVKWDSNFVSPAGKPGPKPKPSVEEEPPKPYDATKDIGRQMERHMEVFQSGGVNPAFKWPQELQQGWMAQPLLHGVAGAPSQLPAKVADPRPVQKAMPTEIPESEEQKRDKDQRRKIEGTLEESRNISEGRDVEGKPGKKFW
jgi:hypothetical protein